MILGRPFIPAILRLIVFLVNNRSPKHQHRTCQNTPLNKCSAQSSATALYACYPNPVKTTFVDPFRSSSVAPKAHLMNPPLDIPLTSFNDSLPELSCNPHKPSSRIAHTSDIERPSRPARKTHTCVTPQRSPKIHFARQHADRGPVGFGTGVSPHQSRGRVPHRKRRLSCRHSCSRP